MDYEKLLRNAFVVRRVTPGKVVNMTRLLNSIDYKHEAFLHHLTDRDLGGLIWRIEFSANGTTMMGGELNSEILNTGEWIIDVPDYDRAAIQGFETNEPPLLSIEPFVGCLNNDPTPRLQVSLFAIETEKQSAEYLEQCHKEFLDQLDTPKTMLRMIEKCGDAPINILRFIAGARGNWIISYEYAKAPVVNAKITHNNSPTINGVLLPFRYRFAVHGAIPIVSQQLPNVERMIIQTNISAPKRHFESLPWRCAKCLTMRLSNSMAIDVFLQPSFDGKIYAKVRWDDAPFKLDLDNFFNHKYRRVVALDRLQLITEAVAIEAHFDSPKVTRVSERLLTRKKNNGSFCVALRIDDGTFPIESPVVDPNDEGVLIFEDYELEYLLVLLKNIT